MGNRGPEMKGVVRLSYDEWGPELNMVYKSRDRFCASFVLPEHAESISQSVVGESGPAGRALEKTIRAGRDAAYRWLRTRILRKTDVPEQGDRRSDAQIAKALETSPSTVLRFCCQFVDETSRQLTRGTPKGQRQTGRSGQRPPEPNSRSFPQNS